MCGELWGREEGLISPISDATPTDGGAFLAPSVSTDTTWSSSKDAYSETWGGESDGEFAEVLEWTDKQVSERAWTETSSTTTGRRVYVLCSLVFEAPLF